MEELKKELLELINEDTEPCVSIEKTARLLGMSTDNLRESIANGTCPFGVGGLHTSGTRFGKVSKLALYNWLMKGCN